MGEQENKFDWEDDIELSLKIPVVPIADNGVDLVRNIHRHWRLVGFYKII